MNRILTGCYSLAGLILMAVCTGSQQVPFKPDKDSVNIAEISGERCISISRHTLMPVSMGSMDLEMSVELVRLFLGRVNCIW